MSAATPSIPACWDHWTLLSEDVRSSIVASYGRGQLTRYAESLLEAVKLWRQAGSWRSKPGERASKTGAEVVTLSTPEAATLNSPEARNVISFVERALIVAARRRAGPPYELERPAANAVSGDRSTSTRRLFLAYHTGSLR